MQLRLSRVLPALLACLLLSLLPGCGSMPQMQAPAAGVPSDRVVYLTEVDGTVRAVPASSVGLRGVSREAAGHDPMAVLGNSEAWTYVFLFFVYLIYYFGYSFYLLGELIWESCTDRGAEQDETAEDEPSEPECPPTKQAQPVR
jgi:hypothetical protein